MTVQPPPRDVAALDALFRPTSIAIIGASGDVRKIGGRPIAFLQRAGYRGAIYPVNPRQTEVQGLPAYARLDAVPGPVDHAIIAVPAKSAKAALEDCVRKGVRVATMFTAGLGEVDDAGRRLQEEIEAICRAGGVRLLGPNSLGAFNVADGVYTTFSAALDSVWPTPGRIAIASQSGAFGTYCYAQMCDRGLGVSYFVSTGNEADIDVADCITWLAEDADTDVILAYLEGCRDGQRLRRALARASANGKRVVLMKVGTSEAGALAAVSHTGSIAGSDAAFQAAFVETGTYRAQGIDELIDVAQACAVGVLPRGRRLGVLTPSGGIGIHLADLAERFGLDLPALPTLAQEAIRALIPFAAPRNPVDTTAQVANDRTLLTRIMEIMVAEGDFDIVFGFLAHMGRYPEQMAELKPVLFDLRRRYPDRLFVLCMVCPREERADLEANGFLLFEDPVRAVQTVAALVRLAERPTAPARDMQAMAVPPLPDGAMDEVACREVLAAAGMSVVPGRTATTCAEAVVAAKELGFPVVLKVLSPDLAHKSDIGGVRLGLDSGPAVAAAWDTMMASVAAAAPETRITGALVTSMVKGGVEVVLGVHRDPTFGPLVMFGLGGVFVEVFRDVVFRLAPLDYDTARAMMREIAGHPLLSGARGREPVDEGAIAEALVALSRFAVAHADSVSDVEINPFIALPRGGFAVDAVILRSPPGPAGAGVPAAAPAARAVSGPAGDDSGRPGARTSRPHQISKGGKLS